MASHKTVTVNSPHVQYTADAILSDYYYDTVQTKVDGDKISAVHHRSKFSFKTNRNVPKMGCVEIQTVRRLHAACNVASYA
jgi:hypothetical protein